VANCCHDYSFENQATIRQLPTSQAAGGISQASLPVRTSSARGAIVSLQALG
jgi:hypothetical protein